MRFRFVLATALVSVIGAHALTYALIGVLPDAAIISLGLESARHATVQAFHADHPLRSYPEVLAALARFDLGRTLDGTSVAREVGGALVDSLPRVALAIMIVTGVALLTAFRVDREDAAADHVASFLAFLPPYVMPFLGLIGLLTIGDTLGLRAAGSLATGVAGITIAVTPAALIAAQTARTMRRNLDSEFARMLTAVGANRTILRTRLLHNLAAEIAPSAEKVFVALIAALLFAEPILGLSGFGSMAVRAVRRADPDLLLGVTLALATAVAFLRLTAFAVRRHYGLEG